MKEKNNTDDIVLFQNLIKKHYYFDYFLDPIQYDFRSYKILYYFHRNNEPLFYLALSYTSIF